MHPTLNPRTSAIVIVSSAVVAAAAMALTRPVPVLPAAVGAAFGAVVGLLQTRALREAADLFRSARTAMDVRRAMTATRAGVRSVGLQWIGVFAALATSLRTGNPLGGIVAGCALLMGVRDLVAVGAVARLAPAEDGRDGRSLD
jgi:hypothetical protein